MVDLTTVQGVEHYLAQTPFAASSVIPLSGGHTNFTYRIILQKPYDSGLVTPVTPVRTVVLKHAEPYAAIAKHSLHTTERQDFESLALRHVAQLINPSPVASIPTLYYEDRQHRAIVMSDTGEGSTTLKTLFETSPPTLETSHILGHSLATFLAHLHTATSILGSHGSNIKALFQPNQWARVATSQFYYGKLLCTVAPGDQDPIWVEPPLHLSPAELGKIAVVAKTMQDRIMTSDDVLAMGDFWPGNIVVSLTPELHVNVVDWEVTRPGLAGLEVGQFVAEMHLLRTFHPLSLASVDVTISSFLATYRDNAANLNSSRQMLLDVAWDAATHFGTHLITITPRFPRGGMDLTRKVVLEGLDYIFHVTDRDEAWLKTSIVGALLL